MKTVVVYRSISGFTKRYAGWIAEDLKGDLIDARKVKFETLLGYDLIVFGGSLHATGINGISLIKDNLEELRVKNVIVFMVGASPVRKGLLEEVRNANFTPLQQKGIAFFYLRGGFDFSKLDVTNKVLMTLLRVRLSFKSERTPDEKGMLASYDKPLDCTRRENVAELVAFARTLE
jgi:flavodoxin